MKYSESQYTSKLIPESIANFIIDYDLRVKEYMILLKELWREDRELLLSFESEDDFVRTIQNYISFNNIDSADLEELKTDMPENDILVIDDNISGLKLNFYLTVIYLSHRYRYINSIWNVRRVDYPMIAVDLFLENFGFKSYVCKTDIYELDDLIPLRKEQTKRYKEIKDTELDCVELVYSESQLWKNIETIELYLNPYGYIDKRLFALDLIKNGVCLIAYKEGDEIKFAPSRFVGYVDNDMLKHESNVYKDGRETSKAISDILGTKAQEDIVLEEAYKNFCQKNSLTVGERKRKYWKMF